MGLTITDFEPVAEVKKKKENILDSLLDATLKTENLMKGQTPLRKSPVSQNWKHILGVPVDNNAVIPPDRKNFFWVAPDKRDEVIKSQWRRYFKYPEKFGLTEDSTLEDAIKKFDQQNPQNKINYLKNKGIDTKKKLKDFGVSLFKGLSDFLMPSASAETIRLRRSNTQETTDFQPVEMLREPQTITDFEPVEEVNPEEIYGGISEYKPQSFFRKMNTPYGEQTVINPQWFVEKLSKFYQPSKAKASNIIAISDMTGIHPSDVEKNYDYLTKKLNLRTSPTPDEMINVMLIPAIATGIGEAPLATIKGIGKYIVAQGITEMGILPALRMLYQKTSSKPVKYEITRLRDLLPDSMKDTGTLVDFIVYGSMAKGIGDILRIPRVEGELAGIRYRILKRLGVKQPTSLVPLTYEQSLEIARKNKIPMGKLMGIEEFKKRQQMEIEAGKKISQELGRVPEPTQKTPQKPTQKVVPEIPQKPEQPIKLYKGIGDNANINRFAWGEHYTTDKGLARTYGKSVIKYTIPKGTKIADLQKIKEEYRAKGIIADPKEITKKLVNEGYEWAKGLLPTEETEYIKLTLPREGWKQSSDWMPGEPIATKGKYAIVDVIKNNEPTGKYQIMEEGGKKIKGGFNSIMKAQEYTDKMLFQQPKPPEVRPETTKPEQSLIKEAKKYKTPEEFVKGVGIRKTPKLYKIIKDKMMNISQFSSKDIPKPIKHIINTEYGKEKWKISFGKDIGKTIGKGNILYDTITASFEKEILLANGKRDWWRVRDVASDVPQKIRDIARKKLGDIRPRLYDIAKKQQEEYLRSLWHKAHEGENKPQEKPVKTQQQPKQAWEMTVKEYTNLPENRTYFETAKREHARSVYTAVREGKPVPPEVLKDYPDLAEKYVEGGEGNIRFHRVTEENLTQTAIDTARSYPNTIEPVGNEFWVELMDAAKKLLTPYRYNALRKSLLGQFNYSGGVKLKDIRDVLTAAHELGHNIDWLMNDKSYPNAIKKRFNTTFKEKDLRAELRKVSQEMRLDLWNIPSKKTYVNKHTELMADFISRYILDPEGTKKIAPKMTLLLERKMPDNIKKILLDLNKNRLSGVKKSPFTEAVIKRIQADKRELKLEIKDGENYIKQTHNLGVDKVRQNIVFIRRVDIQAKRIDDLVPDLDRQVDLVVVAEHGSRNPYTNKTREEVEKTLTDKEKQAIKIYRGYQELARQTVNKYLRNAGYSEYIKFLDDYFIHFYETPLTKKYKSAVGKWYRSSPQAKRRILPDLATAVDMGLEPKAKTLSDGIRLWGGINYKVATNIAYLKELPKIVNADGESIIQSPKDKPDWPTRDYWALRKTYAIPIKGRGILLFQGRVAVDPKVVSSIDALFKTKFYHPVIRGIEKVNAVAKAMELTFFSLFHHQTEAFSGFGAFGPKVITGLLGKQAKELGGKRVLGIHRIGLLEAGKRLEQIPEFTEDYILHGGKLGRITTEGINEVDRMLIALDDKLKEKGTSITKILGFPVTKTKQAYELAQNILWDNVTRLKLVTYYNLVDYGLKTTNLPIDKVKEVVARYVNNNYGGQEWVNMKLMRDPQFRQIANLGLMSTDWTLSQIRMGLMPVEFGKGAEKVFARKLGRRHWGRYLTTIAFFTILGNYIFARKAPWDNEKGHKTDIDWTSAWRKQDEIFSKLTGKPNWKQRQDFTHRYIQLGKAGRELIRYGTEGIKAIGYKLSPIASEIGKQLFGTTMGSDYPAEWKKEELDDYEKTWARIKSMAGKFKPFSLSGNNAFLSFPSRKGMTKWKATKSLADIYRIRAKTAEGGIKKLTSNLSKGIFYNENKLVNEIKRACEINKVDFDKANHWANTKVRTEYYRKLWYNIVKGKGEAQIKALKILGATEKTIKKSGKNHKVSSNLIDKAIEMFKEAK